MKAQTAGTLLLLALPAFAQDDRIVQTNGEIIEGVKVTAFEITEVRFQRGGRSESLATDRVVKVVLGKFTEVYRRGLAAPNDPGQYLNTARERLEKKDPLMAQFGFVQAATVWLSFSDDENVRFAFDCLEEMQKGIPNAGLLPEVYRLKFDYYGGKGDFVNAMAVARKFQGDATAGAWPQGFQLEGEFLVLMAEGGGGKIDKKTFQARLSDMLGRLEGHPALANRANIQLADLMRETGDKDGARRIYEAIADKDGIDDNSRAGALLGLGYIQFATGDATNKEPYKLALLNFLRVHLVTKDAYDSLHAEALYNAMLAADRWQGEDFRRIAGRCRWILINEAKYSGTRWAKMAK